MIDYLIGGAFTLVVFIIFELLRKPKPSDEIVFLRNLLADERKDKQQMIDSLFVYLRIKPAEPQNAFAPPVASSQTYTAVNRGGIREFRAKQQEAERAHLIRERDREIQQINPDAAAQLQRDIAELDAELGTNN